VAPLHLIAVESTKGFNALGADLRALMRHLRGWVGR